MQEKGLRNSGLGHTVFDGQIVSVVDTDMSEVIADPVVNRGTYFFNPENGTYVPANYWIKMFASLAVMELQKKLFQQIPLHNYSIDNLYD